jgi:alkanesulfonate monooxygenase SsuD/methylene tetrahydromethanopterin reductase-like flavin-dependent oxidoreductase (luciferase family)
MRFGIFLAYERTHAPGHYGGANLYDEMLEQAVLADELGFEVIWIPEHHLIHFAQAPSATVLCTQIGLNVRCTVATMVILATYRHPLITAGEIAAVDNILHGRFEVGLGRGAYPYEFERLQIPFDTAKERVWEAVEVLEQIWHSPDAGVEFRGEFFEFASSYVWPRPYQHPHPPLWIAGMTLPTIDRAARAGYNVTTWPFVREMAVLEDAARTFHAGREAAGGRRGEQRFGVLRGTYTARTEERARAQAAEVLIGHRINQRLRNFEENSDPRGYVTPDPGPGEPSLDDVYTNLIWGTPEQCLDKLRAYDALGVDDLLLSFHGEHDVAMESMRVFAEGVMAPFRDGQAAVAGARP